MKWDWSWDNKRVFFMVLALALGLDLAVIYQFTPKGKIVKPKQITAQVAHIETREVSHRQGRYKITMRLQGYKQDFHMHLFKYEQDVSEKIIGDIRVGDEIVVVVNNFRRKIKKARIAGLRKGDHVYRHAVTERYTQPFPWPSFIVSSVIFYPIFAGASFLMLAAVVRFSKFGKRAPPGGN